MIRVVSLRSTDNFFNLASEASPTLGCSIEISRDWASEASPTLGCSIEILRDWAREVSPTLGCSIEISRDIIYVGIICNSYNPIPRGLAEI